MTSVDSGVETGNDSNDSLIVQHENLTSGQISCNTSSTTVASMNSSQNQGQENEQNTSRIGLGPAWSMDLSLPISSLCPGLGNYNCADISQNSGASTSGELVVYPSQGFRPPTNRCVSAKELRGIKVIPRKMRSLHFRTDQYYSGWKEFRETFLERKMRLAAYTNNIELMRRLLNTGVSPDSRDEQGRTPLHLASCRGFEAIVHLLLEHGADPNKRDIIGNTPLHLAAVTSKISVVTLLLKAGTNVHSLDKYGCSPLRIAQKKLRMLQEYGKPLQEDMLKIKEEVHNIIGMLMVYVQKQKDMSEQVETLSSFCSRLSLSNTSDQVQDDVKDLLANINSLSITN
ncbi:ankyrin repeat domain-containing protein 54 isoform X1 [Vespula maculifrons]|nr:ankyrin repeat domain-containing protein 54 isoform X1 [Vespula pensylvanica]XP_043679165.1 ankyrin repeat domain-containing protein 54 isoform X1 [Vespula pensylvanica]XP_050861521.1 ankyrin repeat domain-containing protein 54 isoform X1 [Vespula vulgaris]XP_050861522.1 ankyrin repeat domain-containing protein 54 isoform X1 [Vespula vulgaris]